MRSSSPSDEYARGLLACFKLDLKLTLWIIGMSKVDQFADDIGDIINGLESTFGDLGERARRLQKRGQETAEAYHRHLENREAELRRVEEAIARLTNALPADAVESRPSESAHLHEVKSGD
jgi:hypothetical protein